MLDAELIAYMIYLYREDMKRLIIRGDKLSKRLAYFNKQMEGNLGGSLNGSNNVKRGI